MSNESNIAIMTALRLPVKTAELSAVELTLTLLPGKPPEVRVRYYLVPLTLEESGEGLLAELHRYRVVLMEKAHEMSAT